MDVRIHRGSHEIGGSCIEIATAGKRILIDAGLPLSGFNDGASPPLPQVDFDSLLAVVISHPHLDHYGLLPWLPSTPIVMGSAARRILLAAAPFMRQTLPTLAGQDLVDRCPFTIGPLTITPYLVDHSAYDAYALLIEAEGKRLFYSGDFRLHGRKSALMERLISQPPAAIDALLMEGTTLGRPPSERGPQTEDELEAEFCASFRETSGLALIQTSAQNIDRMVTLYRACQKAGRTLLIDLYTAIILEATGNPRLPQSHWLHVALCVPLRQRIQIKRNAWFGQLNRHARHRLFLKRDVAAHPEKFALLFRDLWRPDLEKAGCLAGASFTYSQWPGYMQRDDFAPTGAWLAAHGIPTRLTHTSGHADAAGLRRFAQAIYPRRLVPIHTVHPEDYNDFGIPVTIQLDGAWWQI
mgnify:CR=1 FL=1